MATVAFKKRGNIAKTNQPTFKRVKRAETESSDEEDEIIRARKAQSGNGLTIDAHKSSKPSTKDLEVIYNASRNAENVNINDATRQTADIDGRNELEVLGRKSVQHAKDMKKSSIGPVKAPSNIRAISIIDYAPDVCKDYKQTGFCGFGDTCKFLHDRGDFKQGWQLDRDWEKAAASKSRSGKGTIAKKGEDKDELEIPFKCTICKNDYKDPIITTCGHYFCEVCALKRYKENPACAQCKASTGGLFSGATKLKTMLKAKQARLDNASIIKAS